MAQDVLRPFFGADDLPEAAESAFFLLVGDGERGAEFFGMGEPGNGGGFERDDAGLPDFGRGEEDGDGFTFQIDLGPADGTGFFFGMVVNGFFGAQAGEHAADEPGREGWAGFGCGGEEAEVLDGGEDARRVTVEARAGDAVAGVLRDPALAPAVGEEGGEAAEVAGPGVAGLEVGAGFAPDLNGVGGEVGDGHLGAAAAELGEVVIEGFNVAAPEVLGEFFGDEFLVGDGEFWRGNNGNWLG